MVEIICRRITALRRPILSGS